jgi:hypothetical protein
VFSKGVSKCIGLLIKDARFHPRPVAARLFQFFICSYVFVRQLYRPNDSLDHKHYLLTIPYLNMHEYLLTSFI